MDRQTKLEQIYDVDKRIGKLESDIAAEKKNLLKRIGITGLIGGVSFTSALLTLKTFISVGVTVGGFVSLGIAACSLPFAIMSFIKTKTIDDKIKSIEQHKQQLFQEKSRIIHYANKQEHQPLTQNFVGSSRSKKVKNSVNYYYEPEL